MRQFIITFEEYKSDNMEIKTDYSRESSPTNLETRIAMNAQIKIQDALRALNSEHFDLVGEGHADTLEEAQRIALVERDILEAGEK